jgi:hypothetical protein
VERTFSRGAGQQRRHWPSKRQRASKRHFVLGDPPRSPKSHKPMDKVAISASLLFALLPEIAFSSRSTARKQSPKGPSKSGDALDWLLQATNSSLLAAKRPSGAFPSVCPRTMTVRHQSTLGATLESVFIPSGSECSDVSSPRSSDLLTVGHVDRSVTASSPGSSPDCSLSSDGEAFHITDPHPVAMLYVALAEQQPRS